MTSMYCKGNHLQCRNSFLHESLLGVTVTSSGIVLASLKTITLELSRQHTPMSTSISDPGYWYNTHFVKPQYC